MCFPYTVDEQYLSGVFLHLFRSFLVSNSAIRHFREFTHAKTARLPRRCPETRLRLYVGAIYRRHDGFCSRSKFGHSISYCSYKKLPGSLNPIINNEILEII